METNFKAMISTANCKHTKLVEYLTQLKNGNDVDIDKVIKLATSIHDDEMTVIMDLYEVGKVMNDLNRRTNIDVPSFMHK